MWESTDTVRRAVAVISVWWEKIKFPNERVDYERCEHREILSPWVYSDNCNKRVSKQMVDEYEMKSTVFGGSGYRCQDHLCTCWTEYDYPEEYCRTCGCYTCARCGSGCMCIDDS